MLVAIYVVVAIAMFLAQVKNGFFMALATALFWPAVVVGLALFTAFYPIYRLIKK